MRTLSIRATRRSRLIATATVVVAATATALTVSQSGVTGAEKDESIFTVAGNGELQTKKPKLEDTRDPLSTKETGYAIQLASTDSSVPKNATDVDGEEGPEFLHADVPDDIDSSGRHALVVLYDYTGNRTYQQLVDLKTGTVSSKSAARLQPPTSPDEAKAAINIAISTELALPFKTQFEKSEGMPLVSPEQVGYVAGAWIFDGSTAGGTSCGADRCARLLVTTPSGNYLTTSDFIVNLSTGQAVSLETP